MADETELVERAKALREECRRGVEDRKVMPDYVDACVALKALAPKLLDTIEALQRERARDESLLRQALDAIESSRSEPLFIMRDAIRNHLEDRAALSGEAS